MASMEMFDSTNLKEAFEPKSKYDVFYTGGNIEWINGHLFCQNPTHISRVNVASGQVVDEIAKESEETVEEDVIVTFTTNGESTITAHKSGLLKLWNSTFKLQKQWKSIHNGPIASIKITEEWILSGGSDGVVRVWDLKKYSCLYALKEAKGVINTLACEKERIFASGDDGNIIQWEITPNGDIVQEYQGHFSKVTCIHICNSRLEFVSAGRDKCLILWSIFQTAALKIIPVGQAIESLIILPIKMALPDDAFVSKVDVIIACAGEKGQVSMWDMRQSKELYQQTNSLISPAAIAGSLAVTHLLCDKADTQCKQIALVSVEQTIIIHDSKSFAVLKQIVGFTDEIIDLTLCGEEDNYIAVATNSKDIKLFEIDGMNCRLLKGHKDLVMAVNTAPFNRSLLVSASKDTKIFVWLIDDIPRCIAMGHRHTSAVTAVCFFNTSKVLVSGSMDRCITVWDASRLTSENVPVDEKLNVLHSGVAHLSDINCIKISPNDKVMASCSQDKTIKLWTENLTHIGQLKGHTRSVWCCDFSPIDQVLVSASADCTIRLWSISDLNCLKTIQGHDASVLRIHFISNGTQLLSCGADGFVKLFNMKSSECILTLDEHKGRIWASIMAKDEATFFTGDALSLLVKWHDVTQEKRLEKLKAYEVQTKEEQELSNYIHEERYFKGLKLALKLCKPFLVLKIVHSFIEKQTPMGETVKGLTNDEKEILLKYANDWNSNTRNSQASHVVLNVLLEEVQAGTFKPTKLSSFLEGNHGYNQRHYKKMTELIQELHFLNYTTSLLGTYSENST